MEIKTGDRFTVVVDVLEARDQGNVAFRIGGATCLASAKAIEAAMVLTQPYSARSGKAGPKSEAPSRPPANPDALQAP